MDIGIFIYPDAEVLDFSGPFEVFSTAARLDDTCPFNVFLIAKDKAPVMARGGYCVCPDYDIQHAPALDVLLVAGGVHTQVMKDQEILKWLQNAHQTTQLTSSVCTGSFLLAEAGIITDHHVTTHWEDINDLEKNNPQLSIHRDKKWVHDGKVVTSGGISSGISMSLYLVSELHSQPLAEKTAKQMEYPWEADAGYKTARN